jgi:hypothetical protein
MRLDDLHWVGARRKELGEQRVGTKRDRGAQGLFALAVATALAADPLLAVAQQNPAPAAKPAPVPAATPAPTPAATPASAEDQQPPANSFFTHEELEKLLALRAAADCPHHWRTLPFPFRRPASRAA